MTSNVERIWIRSTSAIWQRLQAKGVNPPARYEVVCSKCQWNCARRSRRRTGSDLLLALFFLRPFRCRSCRRRYYRLSL
jgi:hypothetical protein